MNLPISYYNWFEKVGGKGVALHIGCINTHPDADKPLIEEFKLWQKEWKEKGLSPKKVKRSK